MTKTKLWTARLLIATVAFVLCGLDHAVLAQSAPQNDDAAASGSAPNSSGQAPEPGMVDPSKGPLQPVPAPEQNVPEAPNPQTTTAPAPDSSPSPNAKQQAPAGVAVGQRGVTAGGAASRPAGSAIAPAQQHQYRSLLIKIGVIAAAGAALGTVVALTRGSPSKPPGAQ
jgi:hypothetical protein